MTGSAAFLVDTNVLVYAYDPQAGSKRDRAIAVLDTVGSRQIGALTPQIMGEFFVVVTQKLTPPLTAAEAERTLTNYARSWIVHDLTRTIHDRFYCNRGYAAATGGLAARSVNILQEYASLPRVSTRRSRDASARFRHEPS